MQFEKEKQELLKALPDLPDYSGIYILTREENGFKYAYIGQAKNIAARVTQHLTGYQHIDFSIRSHGIKGQANQTGWDINTIYYPEEMLDEKEQFFIREYANAGYQLRNKTAGGQSDGKFKIADIKPAKGYYDGLKQGEKNLKRKLKHIVEKYLVIGLKKDNISSRKALDKFNKLLEEQKEENYGEI